MLVLQLSSLARCAFETKRTRNAKFTVWLSMGRYLQLVAQGTKALQRFKYLPRAMHLHDILVIIWFVFMNNRLVARC